MEGRLEPIGASLARVHVSSFRPLASDSHQVHRLQGLEGLTNSVEPLPRRCIVVCHDQEHPRSAIEHCGEAFRPKADVLQLEVAMGVRSDSLRFAQDMRRRRRNTGSGLVQVQRFGRPSNGPPAAPRPWIWVGVVQISHPSWKDKRRGKPPVRGLRRAFGGST